MGNINHNIFKQAQEKPWITGRVFTNGTFNNTKWSMPVDELFLGDDWYLEKWEIISAAPINSVIVDVGCNHGDWTGRINHVLPKGITRIGIDPIHYNTINNIVDYYHQCAIDDINQSSKMTFHIFDEPGCNSLLNKSEHLTMRNILNTISVSTKTLESILLEHVHLETIIYYIKCDCQGKDTDVIKSLRSFLPFTKYVQIESAFSYNKLFYEGQPSYEEDINKMDQLGFEPIFYMEYLQSPLPEGEILFKNRNL